MWRAFFFAVGYLLIFFGAQSLMFEQIQLANDNGVPPFVKRMLQNDGSAVAPRAQPLVSSSGDSFASGEQSSFGPSRFNGGFGGGNFSAAPYRSSYDANGRPQLGVRSGAARGIPQIDLAGYQTRTNETIARPSTPGRVIRAQDWMPWSLLAIGSVVVLYTRSFGTSAYHHD